MASYCFFSPEAQELAEKCGIDKVIVDFAESAKKQAYVLRAPLAKSDSEYDYENAIALFISGMRPCFIDIGEGGDLFEEFGEDFIEDIAFLSEKYKYREKIGRKKKWESLFEFVGVDDFLIDGLTLNNQPDARLVDLITSLVVGSINDVSKVDLDPESLLDMVKSKIILFDTDQTSFVFKPSGGKKYVIQGLAGSGKTELLLHKMKEIYSNDAGARIAFTCFNKILASSMKNRIPGFFDFMRVERQIDWGNKLFCFHAWGSGRLPWSGMYRYICHFYEIPFGTFQAGTFDYLCKKAAAEIRALPGDREFAFDYVFIDESQDFSESFIDLCELVTEKKLFVAGDVFQNIFRPIDQGVNMANMVLEKCYRTDPKNLMFSHALGMGLFEEPVMRWLKPSEWAACGYSCEENDGRVDISRDPLRRFEDIPDDYQSTILYKLEPGDSCSAKIVSVVMDIVRRNPTVKPGDIAVIFLDKDNYIYDVVSRLKADVFDQFGWDCNVSFETKVHDSERFFVSNINNAKGLEFPFVICFSQDLKRSRPFRNALYTMMARSFLESHLILGDAVDGEILKRIGHGLSFLSKQGYMNVRLPSAKEIEGQIDMISLDEAPSVEEKVRAFCKEKGASARLVGKLLNRVAVMLPGDDYDEDYFYQILEAEYNRHKVL